jgi:hypothetical protein
MATTKLLHDYKGHFKPVLSTKRDERLVVRLTLKEKDAIETLAEAQGLNTSDFVRYVAIHSEMIFGMENYWKQMNNK